MERTMSTTTAPKIAPISGYTTDESFYATRYKQGGRTVFLIALTPDQIINNIIEPDPLTPTIANRAIRLNHAQGFASYYLERDGWVVPGVILRAPSIFDFQPQLEAGDGVTDFGILSYPKRKARDIQILDGQHRILGFHIALKKVTDDIAKARDHVARAKRTEHAGSKAIKDAEDEVKRLEKKRDRFYQERVSVEIKITESTEEARQMFVDIADNQLGISTSVKARFDKRKVVNRALELVSAHPLLEGRVDPENDRLGRNSPYLLSARHITEIIRSVTAGIDGRIGKVMERDLSEFTVAERALTLLSLLVEAFPQLKAIEDGTLLPDQLRQTSLLGSPLFLRILAGTYHELAVEHERSDDEIRGFFAALAQHVHAPVHAESIWMNEAPADTFNLNAYGPNGRRQDIVALSSAIWDWALDKAPFVYAAPQPAPEAHVDPDAGLDFAPSYSAKSVQNEARIEAEEISAAAKARGKG
jgi:hypothetical protein